MKNLPLFILFFVALLFVGCEKDIIGEAEDPTIIRTDPTELKLGNITGLVFDENNSPVENAVIEYSREIYTTDVNGYFRIKDTGASAAGGLVKINKDGYFKSFKFAFIETQQTSHLRIQLIEKNDAQSLNGTNGGIISVNGGGKITFPERSLVDENNVSYEGEATIYTHWYNPSDDNLNASMPGDLRGVSNDEKLVQLSIPIQREDYTAISKLGTVKRGTHMTIKSYKDLNPILGQNWYFRIINAYGDFCYVIRNTVEFWIYDRRPLVEFTENSFQQNIERGCIFRLRFVHGNGNKTDLALFLSQN